MTWGDRQESCPLRRASGRRDPLGRTLIFLFKLPRVLQQPLWHCSQGVWSKDRAVSIVRRGWSRWSSRGRSGAWSEVCGAPSAGGGGRCSGWAGPGPSSRAAPLTPCSSLGAGSGYPTQTAFSSCRRVPPALLGTRCHCHRRVEAGWAFPRGSLSRDTVSCSLGNVPWPLLFPHPCPSASPHWGAVPGKWAGLDPPR